MGIYVMKAAALKDMLEVQMPDANDFGNEVSAFPPSRYRANGHLRVCMCSLFWARCGCK